MTTSSAKAEANRRNAQKSTGPKTAAGKNRIRLNALRHALYAYVSNLSGEDEEQHFIQGIHEELQPEGQYRRTDRGMVQLGRLRHAFYEHQAERIDRRAVARDNRLLFKMIREKHGNTPAGVQRANATIETILDTADADPIPPDPHSVLDEVICDEGEARIIADVDRRMRHLMRDIDDGLELLDKMQRRRRAVLVLPPPARSAPDAQGPKEGRTSRELPPAHHCAPAARSPDERPTGVAKKSTKPIRKPVTRPEVGLGLFSGIEEGPGGATHQTNGSGG